MFSSKPAEKPKVITLSGLDAKLKLLKGRKPQAVTISKEYAAAAKDFKKAYDSYKRDVKEPQFTVVHELEMHMPPARVADYMIDNKLPAWVVCAVLFGDPVGDPKQAGSAIAYSKGYMRHLSTVSQWVKNRRLEEGGGAIAAAPEEYRDRLRTALIVVKEAKQKLTKKIADAKESYKETVEKIHTAFETEVREIDALMSEVLIIEATTQDLDEDDDILLLLAAKNSKEISDTEFSGYTRAVKTARLVEARAGAWRTITGSEPVPLPPQPESPRKKKTNRRERSPKKGQPLSPRGPPEE